MEEIWKPVLGYEGQYEVSNLGIIRSLKTNIILSPGFDRKYLVVCLRNNGKAKTHRVHNIVWESFNGVKGENNAIHHKDHNVYNNSLDNLEELSISEHNAIHKSEHAKPVIQYDLNNNYIREYNSVGEAEKETNIRRQSIRDCCYNKYGYRTAGGFIWKFKS